MTRDISVRVDEPTYRALLKIQHRLERQKHRRVAIGEAVKELVNNQKEE